MHTEIFFAQNYSKGVVQMIVKRKKINLAVALIVAVNLLIIALAQSADAALYKRGSSGATVTEIQTPQELGIL